MNDETRVESMIEAWVAERKAAIRMLDAIADADGEGDIVDSLNEWLEELQSPEKIALCANDETVDVVAPELDRDDILREALRKTQDAIDDILHEAGAIDYISRDEERQYSAWNGGYCYTAWRDGWVCLPEYASRGTHERLTPPNPALVALVEYASGVFCDEINRLSKEAWDNHCKRQFAAENSCAGCCYSDECGDEEKEMARLKFSKIAN